MKKSLGPKTLLLVPIYFSSCLLHRKSNNLLSRGERIRRKNFSAPFQQIMHGFRKKYFYWKEKLPYWRKATEPGRNLVPNQQEKMLQGWHSSVEYGYFNTFQKSLPEKSYKRLCRKVFANLEIPCTRQIRKTTFFPSFFVLVTFTNFYILANLRCCEPGGGVTKTDTSGEMKMEDGYSDGNVSTSKMTTSSKETSQVPRRKRIHKMIGFSWQK